MGERGQVVPSCRFNDFDERASLSSHRNSFTRLQLLMCRLFLFAVCLLVTSLAIADERPNVVWIIADDLGPELGCYGYPDVATPNLDRLAASGRRYNRAFSTAPVCSASRTAFQTGLYQTTVGGHHHDTHDKRVLPDSIPTVTGLM